MYLEQDFYRLHRKPLDIYLGWRFFAGPDVVEFHFRKPGSESLWRKLFGIEIPSFQMVPDMELARRLGALSAKDHTFGKFNTKEIQSFFNGLIAERSEEEIRFHIEGAHGIAKTLLARRVDNVIEWLVDRNQRRPIIQKYLQRAREKGVLREVVQVVENAIAADDPLSGTTLKLNGLLSGDFFSARGF